MADLIVLNNQLIQARANYTLGLTAPTPNWTLRLFVNNHTPLCTDLVATLTECTLAGYAPISLTPGSWSGGITACVDTSTYPAQTFTFTAGGQTVFGNYVYDSSNAVLGWVDLWETPFVVPGGGGAVSVTLQWVEKQC